jgi:maltose alpha-D-glucosyltransferase/alpha-amylase
LIDIADGASSKADEKGFHTVMLDAYGYRWYRVGGLDYLLRRKEI